MITIIDCGSSKSGEFVTILQSLGFESEMVKMKDIRNINLNLSRGLIISGSPILLTDEDHGNTHEKFSFIKELEIPVLGVCFGHQIIGLLYGASISIGNEISGLQSVDIFNRNTIFTSLNTQEQFYESHREEITLPDNFQLLASSETCHNETMKHKSRPLYGIQFHPEISGDAGKVLLKNFAEVCFI